MCAAEEPSWIRLLVPTSLGEAMLKVFRLFVYRKEKTSLQWFSDLGMHPNLVEGLLRMLGLTLEFMSQ